MTYEEAAEAAQLHYDENISLRSLGVKYGVSHSGLSNNINAYKRGDTEYFVSRKLNVFNLGNIIHVMTLKEITELYNATYGTDLPRYSIRDTLKANSIPYKKRPKNIRRIHPVKERTNYGSIVKEVSEALILAGKGLTSRELANLVPYTFMQTSAALQNIKYSKKYNLMTYDNQGKRYYRLNK